MKKLYKVMFHANLDPKMIAGDTMTEVLEALPVIFTEKHINLITSIKEIGTVEIAFEEIYQAQVDKMNQERIDCLADSRD